MTKTRAFLCMSLVLSLSGTLLAELPLPDATFYGKLTTPAGAAIRSGSLTARIRRGAAVVLTVPGAFASADGEDWYVVRIPLETNIGAPGPSGVAAREGDVLDALLLNNAVVELKSAAQALKAGLLQRIDGTGPEGSGDVVFFRGDCSPDQKLSLTDAIRVLNFLFISPAAPPCLSACDADDSGVLNITDGVYILTFLFLGGPAPPAPGPKCGVDPSPNNLGCAQPSCVL